MVALDPRVDIPLTVMDDALLTQTGPGRPMLTHHVLEYAAPLSYSALECAAAYLARSCAPLRSTVRQDARGFTRTAHPFDPERARARLEVATETPSIDSSWWSRAFQLEREWPFRVLACASTEGTSSLVFTLHHSVCDGAGALRLFDWYLRSAVAFEHGARPPECPFTASRGQSVSDLLGVGGASLAGLATRSAARFRQHYACLLDAPASEPAGTHVLTVDVPPEEWRRLGTVARTKGCTRHVLLWVAALKAFEQTLRRAGTPEPLRLLGTVDLRDHFDAQSQLGNWLGTLELAFSAQELRASGLEATVTARLAEAREPARALVTPFLLGVLGATLGTSRAGALYRSRDDGAHPWMYSALISFLRPPAPSCWPAELAPRRLWCASTLPRKPGLGLTVTAVGDVVAITATWPGGLCSEEGVRALLAELLGQLQATR